VSIFIYCMTGLLLSAMAYLIYYGLTMDKRP